MWSDRSLRMRMKMSTQKIIRIRTRPVATIPEEAARAGQDMTAAAEEDRTTARIRTAAEEVRTAAVGTVVRREELEGMRSLGGGNLGDESDNLGNHNAPGTEPEDGLGAEGGAGESQLRDPRWSAGQRALLSITLTGVSTRSLALTSPCLPGVQRQPVHLGA